ncbi:MAG TPA: amino acid permease, partial [Acidimicrobiales bacterium]|nr:amino acid permease [Acidimicrobiales bacterium]
MSDAPAPGAGEPVPAPSPLLPTPPLPPGAAGPDAEQATAVLPDGPGRLDAGVPMTVAGREVAPAALPLPGGVALPETARYRFKNAVLGPPLASERQAVERLGKPTALAVLSSDVISSSAYATEQVLLYLIPAIGVAAFSLVVPVTVAVICVLLFVTLSYLEVVKVYTKAGGAYVVARENFGLGVAQIAAVALLIDYTLTVAVSVAAGVAALVSVFPGLGHHEGTTIISVVLVLLIAYGNLRGIREAGRVFAVPTYFFIGNMALLLVVGIVKALLGDLHPHSLHQPGAIGLGAHGSGLLMGASLFIVAKAFASGGSALTGTEAISNGVSVFRPPESRNARQTLVLMSVILGSLVLGVSLLASRVHPVPRRSGTPTVLAQVAQYVYGTGAFPHALYILLQAGTMLILVLAANTSFTGFPFLASFAADDSYLPRQLTRRGHRLVFSTGIIVLTVVSIALLVVTKARVDSLIPLYAIGVFTGFTMAGAGMVKFHLTTREPQWRRRALINGTAAVLSFVVLLIFAVTKFTSGAWVVVVLLPLGVAVLLRLHRQYVREDEELELGASAACEAPVLRRHTVVVLVDRMDLATARAVQYARTLTPDELRAVHFAIDPREATALERDWSRLGLSRLPLDIIECPDRRLARAALELAAQITGDGDTELTVLLPRRGFAAGWRRLLHDRSADRIAAAVGHLPHVNATIVPFQLVSGWREKAGKVGTPRDATPRPPKGTVRMAGDLGPAVPGTTPISAARWRQRVRVAGRVRSVRVPTAGATANLECTLVDGGGAILLVFQGRRRIPGVQQGARLVAQGMVGAWEGRL